MKSADRARFWSKVDQSDDDCWLWRASVTAGGYGQINVEGRILAAHRVSFQLAVRPLEPGETVDHLCRVRRCVNPAHLRACSVKENAENRAPQGEGASGYRGVTWDRSRGQWVAKVTHHYQTVNVGRFATREEAASAAAAARLTLFTHSDSDRKAS